MCSRLTTLTRAAEAAGIDREHIVVGPGIDLGKSWQQSLHVVADGIVVEVAERGLTDHELRVVTADGEEVLRSEENPIAAEDREFVDVLLGRLPRVRVPYGEALRTHALTCAADRSARNGGQPVDPRIEGVR